MTVICYRDGCMAADKEAGDQYLKTGRSTKIHVIRGHLVGCTGDAVRNEEWRAWFAAGANPSDFHESFRDRDNAVTALVVDHDGNAWRYQHSPYPTRAEEPCIAIGAGREAAMAAMYLGHSVEDAVRAASYVCQGVGGGIDVLHLDDIDAA